MNALNLYLLRVEQKWKTCHNKIDYLPELCLETIEELDLFLSVRSLTTNLSYQELKRNKAHPANGIIAVAESEFLGMYLHYWFDDIATPHHHAWTGFFMNLKGRVIHSVYDFAEEEPLGPHLAFGELRNLRTEVIAEGTAVPVHPGAGYIHSLWHIDSPCISLSVRIKSSKFVPDTLTLDYDRWSGTAFCVSQRDDVSQLYKWLKLLLKTDEVHYYQIIDEVITREDVTTVILLLGMIMNTEMDLDLADYLKNQSQGMAPGINRRYATFAEGLARNRLFTNIRFNVADPELRGLFGALYLAGNLDHFLEIFRLIYTDEEPEKRAAHLLFMAIATPEVQASSIQVRNELFGFFESVLNKEYHKGTFEQAVQNGELTEEEKEFVESLIRETQESLIFQALFEVAAD